jgi:hypothetical protein
MYPILALFSLLLLTWGAAVWASYAEPSGSPKSGSAHDNTFMGG